MNDPNINPMELDDIMSEEDKIQELSILFTNCLRRFSPIWDKIGIGDNSRRQRLDIVKNHVHRLLEQMLEEEDTLYKKLLENIKLLIKQETELCSELNLPRLEKVEEVTVVKQEKDLRTRVDALTLEKHSRLKLLKKLIAEDKHWSDTLTINSYDISSDKVPTSEDIRNLEIHIAEAKAEKDKRRVILQETRAKINDLMKDLDLKETDDVVCEKESSLFSAENMKLMERRYQELQQLVLHNKSLASSLREQLADLWEKLEFDQQERDDFLSKVHGHQPKIIGQLMQEVAQCKSLRLKNIQMYVEKLRMEIVNWWDQCLFSREQKDLFEAFYDESYSEDLLNKHDFEIKKLKDYYHSNKDLIKKIVQKDELWKKMLALEKRAQDPNRFNNRGGALLQEEKERKQLLKILMKIEKDLETQIKKWEEEHGQVFLVYGKSYLKYLEEQKQAFLEEKENEKIERQKMKTAKPGIVNKRKFHGTPSKSPKGKRAKMASGSVPRIHSSLAGFNSLSSRSDGFKKRSTNKKTTNSSNLHKGMLKKMDVFNGPFDRTRIILPMNGVSDTSATNSYSEFSAYLNEKSEKTTCRSSAMTGTS